REIGDGGITYPCGAGRAIHIYPSPDNAGKSGGTIAAWEGENLENTVDELIANGVSFEQVHSDRIKTNEKGIAALGDDRVAWFKDPDGNVHGIAQIGPAATRPSKPPGCGSGGCRRESLDDPNAPGARPG